MLPAGVLRAMTSEVDICRSCQEAIGKHYKKLGFNWVVERAVSDEDTP